MIAAVGFLWKRHLTRIDKIDARLLEAEMALERIDSARGATRTVANAPVFRVPTEPNRAQKRARR